MSIAVTGLNHHTSAIELRERLTLPSERLPAALHQLRRRFPEGGAVILSTCNRVEVYAHAELPPDRIHAELRAFLAEWSGMAESAFAEALYEHHDRAAVSHLFKVAASLDSMVVGEGQILGQVHDAYLAAQAEEAVDKVLGVLFQRAFKVAKDVRTRTRIGEGHVSVASVAVDLAVSIFSDLADKTVLVLGSGETGELALKSLVDRGVSKVIVANRTRQHAETLAQRFRGEALGLDALATRLHEADIVISSTASETPILFWEDFYLALKRRNNAPIFVIDIAVPRDIDAGVNTLDNVYLYDIDDLQQVAEENMAARRSELARAIEIVEHQADQFMRWRQALHAEPAIVGMSQELHAIAARELEKTLQKLPDLTEKQRAEVEYLSRRIVNNILQRPLTQLKKEAAHEDAGRLVHLIRRLFGIEEGA